MEPISLSRYRAERQARKANAIPLEQIQHWDNLVKDTLAAIDHLPKDRISKIHAYCLAELERREKP